MHVILNILHFNIIIYVDTSLFYNFFFVCRYPNYDEILVPNFICYTCKYPTYDILLVNSQFQGNVNCYKLILTISTKIW